MLDEMLDVENRGGWDFRVAKEINGEKLAFTSVPI